MSAGAGGAPGARLGIVLQARLDSSRLPGKSLLPLGGKPLALRAMEALRGVPADARVLACPEDSAAAFLPLAKAAGFELLAGPKEDVLARYCLAIREFGLGRVIRATGDNPFVFADAAAAIDSEAAGLGADYAGYSGLPLGAGVESVAAEALLYAEKNSGAPLEREHVCPYLYGRPDVFLLHRPLAPRRWQGAGMRFTVDTPKDYERAQALCAALDRLEGEGRLGGGGRHDGAAIIAAYVGLFQGAPGEKPA